MTERQNAVCIYVFDAGDGKRTDERLALAASRYAWENGISLPAFDKDKLFAVSHTDRGKPYFANCSQICVSVSHSGGYCVCACSTHEIGIDIQEHVTHHGETQEQAESRFRKTARRFFHPVEARFTENETFQRFFTVWTAKESYVKFTGQGIDDSFSTHCCIPDTEELWKSLDCRETSWQAMDSHFYLTRFAENYTMCVCSDICCDCRFIYVK